MPYQQIYRLSTKNAAGHDVIVHVSDTTSGSIDLPTYHDMTLVSLEVSTVNDGEDKPGIRGKKVVFSFLATETDDVHTFLAGADNRWQVEIFVGNTSNLIFVGYLITDATKTKFQAPRTYTIEMSASDNLAILKETPLVKFDGSVPRNFNKWIEYIAWCLSFTNLQLPIKAAFNLFEETYSGSTQAIFDKIYFDAKTFESEIDTREDCYSVLQKLLPGCILTQELGVWWIVRVDEMDDIYRLYNFTYLGLFGTSDTYNPIKQIGKDLPIKLINRDAEIYPERPKKYVQQNFRFNQWQELVCNIDFARGNFNVIAVPPGYAAYNIDCWTAQFLGGTPTVTSYIRRQFVNGYETERVVVIPAAPLPGNYILSEDFRVNTGDKISFSVDRRFSINVSGSSGVYRDDVAEVRLYANDGTFYVLVGPESPFNEGEGSWRITNGTFNGPARRLQYKWNVTQEDERQWQNVSVSSLPVPKPGKIRIALLQSGVFGSITDTQFANLNIDYIPLINGIYQKLTGQYHKVSSPAPYRAFIDEEIFIGDSPNPNFKGTIWKNNGTDYVQAGRWYDYRAGTTGKLGLEKMGSYMIFDLWNQHNRVIRKFQGSLSGLDTNTPLDMPGLLHRYQFTAPGMHTDNKYYMLLSYTQNLVNCQWSGVFSDVYDSSIGKDYSSTHEFKYTTK
jgi:hypothetical protein